MNVPRMIAVALIYVFACAGWLFLGATTEERSYETSSALGREVQQLVGVPLVQRAPSFGVQIPGTNQVRWLMPTRNSVQVQLTADHRRKGLIWYPTYAVRFVGNYTLTNTEPVVQKVRMHFDFPHPEGTYDQFALRVDGQPLNVNVATKEGIGEIVELPPGASRTFGFEYVTRGMTEWRYALDPNIGRVQNFELTATTNFANYDYADGTWAATTTQATGEGTQLAWTTTDLITNQDIGILIPEKLNPGPLTSRITFFAPVCLLFFFVLVLTMQILHGIDMHPMHYLFVAAGFFAFHLLLAYLVGVVNIHVAFIISAVVSVFLVTSYLARTFEGRFPWFMAVGGQVFFLVLFSYSFFLKGVTGLTVAIGSVLVLAYLMRATAHIRWEKVFRRNGKQRPPAISDLDLLGSRINSPPA